MSSIAKYISTSKICQNAFKTSRSLNCRYVSTTSVNMRNRSLITWPFNDVATNFIRNMEREFEWARRNMERTLGDLSRFDLLPPSTSTVDNDFVEIDEKGNRNFRLVFDLKGYDPENIKVKTKENNLILSAKQEKKSKNEYYLSEFSQSYRLPEDLKIDDLKSSLTDEGLLIIEAQLPKLEEGKSKKKERKIMIEKGDDTSPPESAGDSTEGIPGSFEKSDEKRQQEIPRKQPKEIPINKEHEYSSQKRAGENTG